MILVWRIVLVGVVLFLAWRVVTTGLGSYYADRMQAGDGGAYEQVLTWLPEHPGALLTQAVRLMADDPAQAQALLVRAYDANPTDPRPLMVLATRYEKDGETARADALMEIATTLTPVDPRIQRQLAGYWAERGDAERALRHLSTVMEAAPSQRRELNPTLLKIAEDPSARALLVPYALSPPVWWDGFFKHAAWKAGTLEPVRFLYNTRRKVDAAPLTDEERAAYVARLQKDGLISEAYLVWITGLDESERQQLGMLNNGSFEAELTNQGFDWRLARNDRVDVRRLATYGTVGKRALKLSFRANERRFWHLYQPLFLDAGTYRLSGQARGDSLTTKGGLKWQVTCLLPEKQRLGESMRLLGSSDWTQFEFDFEVPESCKSQQLWLVSAGNRAFELKIQGDLWFDNMRIIRTAGLSPAARADALTLKNGGETSTPPASPAKIR